MEKKAVAAVASLTLAALLAGMLLGGTMVKPQPATTSYVTVTVAETTVEVPVRHQPAPYSAVAYTTCTYTQTTPDEDPLCDKNVKTVQLTILFRELGVEKSYLNPSRVVVMTPGLGHNATAHGTPLDAQGRIVIMPGGSASITITTPVTDMTSFANWMADIGQITVIIPYEDWEGKELGTISVKGIPLEKGVWYFNSTEAGRVG